MLIAYKHLVFVESNVVSSHAPKVGVWTGSKLLLYNNVVEEMRTSSSSEINREEQMWIVRWWQRAC
jgi:hypothetical protein